MKLTSLLLITLALGQLSALHPLRKCSKNKKWSNLSVSSSGTATLKNATDGASYTANTNKENVLMTNAHTGVTLNHNKVRENSRLIGGDVTSIETSGNNEIDIGGAALLKKAGRKHKKHYHGHGHGYGPFPCYGGYPRPYYGYGGAHAHANAHAHAHGRGGRASAGAHAHARGGWNRWGRGGAHANAHAKAKVKGGKGVAKAGANAGANTWGWRGRGGAHAHANAHAKAKGGRGRASASANADAGANYGGFHGYLGSDQ